MRFVVFAAVVAALPLAAQEAPKPAAASPYASVMGTVEQANLPGKTFSVKPDKSDATTVKFDERTAFKRVPAGETDVKKATPIAAADVNVGDRILARVFTDSPTGKPATTFYVMKQADLAQRQQKTLDEWRTQSVSGLVAAVDKSAKTVTVKVASPAGPPKDVTVDISGKVSFERYSPETGKYTASDGAAIGVGDQFRVIGTKNADVTAVKADAVQSGGFKTISAQIRSIDAAGMQIAAFDPTSKKPINISLKPFTTMKRLDDQSALTLARRLNPNFQQAGGGRGNRGGGAPGAGGPPAGMPAGMAGGRGPGAGGGRSMDPMRIIEQNATIQIADLKPGEPLIITGVGSDDPTKITAVTLIAGVDVILRASPNAGADPLGGTWNMGGGGDGGGQ